MKTKKIAICPKCWAGIVEFFAHSRWKIATDWKNFKCPYPTHNSPISKTEEEQDDLT